MIRFGKFAITGKLLNISDWNFSNISSYVSGKLHFYNYVEY